MSGNNGAEAKDEEDDKMKDITDPRETDVLCGRGGAALRHPGNQTYRRLVNLNKSLYITCLKTEKLKISRSIVAAIREQHGRFLERDAKKQTWYDIGDKKAIEKTSQALREGQPKLRQKMIDTGQIPPNHDSDMQNQFGNGIYNPGSRPPSFGGGSHSGFGSGVGSRVFNSDASQLSLSSFGPASMQMPTSFTGSNMDMPPPPSRTLSNDPMRQDSLANRLSLSSIPPQSVPSWTPSVGSMDGDSRSVRSRLRPSLQPAGSGVGGELGFQPEATMSIMSDFSGYGMNDGNFGGGGGMEMEMRNSMMSNAASMPNNNNFSHPGGSGGQNSMMESPSMRTGYDRRRLFAKMKIARQPSGAGRTDGMPDIHMVDSQFSLMSNLSGHGNNSRPDRNALSNLSGHGLSNTSGHGLSNMSGHGLSNLSGHGLSNLSGHGLSNLSGHADSMMMDPMGLGSRRSLMSGLSRISDHSVNSVFSDLTKKLGSTSISNRSVAMSEVSGVDEEDEDDDDSEDEFHYDVVPPVKTG
jgi:hypothetical protein